MRTATTHRQGFHRTGIISDPRAGSVLVYLVGAEVCATNARVTWRLPIGPPDSFQPLSFELYVGREPI